MGVKATVAAARYAARMFWGGDTRRGGAYLECPPVRQRHMHPRRGPRPGLPHDLVRNERRARVGSQEGLGHDAVPGRHLGYLLARSAEVVADSRAGELWHGKGVAEARAHPRDGGELRRKDKRHEGAVLVKQVAARERARESLVDWDHLHSTACCATGPATGPDGARDGRRRWQTHAWPREHGRRVRGRACAS